MEYATDILKQMGVVVAVVIGCISGLIYIIKTFRQTNKQVDAETIKTYQDSLDAISKKVEIIERENKELHAQVNQLIGENRTLKDALALRDPDVLKKIGDGFDSMTRILTCLERHDANAVTIEQKVDEIKTFCENDVKPFIKKGVKNVSLSAAGAN